MNRAFVILFVVGILFWLGWRIRRTNQSLAIALYTAATVLFLLLLGGLFGIIGG